jgi:hypothetical protein
MLISYCTNAEMQINLSTADLVLLTQFVANSNAFRANDQHWVPICLPDFNAKGYLQVWTIFCQIVFCTRIAHHLWTPFKPYLPPHQAYISHLRLSLPKTQLTADVTVILMASSADPELFRELHRGRKYLEQVVNFVALLL